MKMQVTKSEDQRKNEFLIGLAKLTRETGIIIGGCGCCDSPFIYDGSINELSDECAGYGYASEHVAWISQADEYYWGEYNDSIVREEDAGS